MTRVLVAALLLAYLPLASQCAWWKSTGQPIANCAEAALAPQVSALLSELLAGNFLVLAGAAVEVLDCALAQLTAHGPGMGSVSSPKVEAAIVAIRAELAKRKAAAKK